jgi:hypothetical protein
MLSLKPSSHWKKRNEEGERKEIDFDIMEPVAVEYQEKLEKSNATNRRFEITYRPIDSWEGTVGSRKRIRPVLFARFTDNFNLHGRIYTEGRYGHQALSKLERKTIRFDGEPSVELDFSGLHPRMLYHLEFLEYTKDPYALWRKETTPPMRLMAKVCVNALINAASPASAVSACNRAMSYKTKKGKRKTGKALHDAQNLYNAAMKTGLKFADMVPLVIKRHQHVKTKFGCDMGIKLMRKDSQIVVNVLDYFADINVPCLPCHDSFIVPLRLKKELKRIMMQCYGEVIPGWLPIIK